MRICPCPIAVRDDRAFRRGRHPRLSVRALRHGHRPGRFPSVSSPVHPGQAPSALVRGSARGLDHLPAVLSGGAAAGLSLCPCSRSFAAASAARRAPGVLGRCPRAAGHARGLLAVPAHARRRMEARSRAGAPPAPPLAALGELRLAVPRPGFHGAVAPILVPPPLPGPVALPALRALVVTAAGVVSALDHGTGLGIAAQIVLYSAALFAYGMACHGELPRLKPEATRLTSFYLVVAAGGAAGGLFAGVLAPRIFLGFWELHLALLGAPVLLVAALLIDPGSWLNVGTAGRVWTARIAVYVWLGVL